MTIAIHQMIQATGMRLNDFIVLDAAIILIVGWLLLIVLMGRSR